MNVFDLSPHELDVIRTFASAAGGLGGLIGGVGAVYSYLARHWARQAAQQTRREEWTDGKLKTMSVADIGSRAMHYTQEVRQELSDFVNDPPIRPHGRRRLPTDTIRLPPEETKYE